MLIDREPHEVIGVMPAGFATAFSPTDLWLRHAQFLLYRSTIIALLGGVAALALIACANLANLTLARVMSRRQELALRAMLGGGRGAIVRLQLIESLWLAVAGGAAGLVAGRWAVPALLSLDPSIARTFGGSAGRRCGTAVLTVKPVRDSFPSS